MIEKKLLYWMGHFVLTVADNYGNEITVDEYNDGDTLEIGKISGPHNTVALTRDSARELAERLTRFVNGGRIVTDEERINHDQP